MAQSQETIKPIKSTTKKRDGESDTERMTGKARREQLIKVAISLFARKGFTGTTTKEIAHAARVNEAMIFRHFATKDDLYRAILDYKANEVCVGDWVEELHAFAAQTDDEGLFRAVAMKKLTMHKRDKNNEFMRLMHYSALEGHELTRLFLERQARPMQKFLQSYIEERQRAGAFRQINSRVAVNMFIGALNHHAMTRAFLPSWNTGLSDERLVENLIALFLGGLRGGAVGTKEKKAATGKAKSEGKNTL